ncbi:MAG: hypothetical protein ACI91B_000868 [Planctomycetota bacterium]|jgi:hypothetical protein
MLQRLLPIASATLTSLLAAAICAQSPLSTTFGGGETGQAVYFTLTCNDPAGITITSFDLNLDAPLGTVGNVVFAYACEGSSHTSLNWKNRDQAAFVAAGPGQPTTCTLQTQLPVGANETIQVAIIANSAQHLFSPPTPILPTTFSTTELTLGNSLASLQPYAGAELAGRMVNASVHYVLGGTALLHPCTSNFGPNCGMTLEPVIMPQIGMPPVTFRVRTEGIPAPTPATLMFHVGVIGFGPENAPLDQFGLVGCKWLARGDQHYIVPLFVPGTSFTWFPLQFSGIPNNIALAGTEIYLQSAVIGTTANSAFGGAGAEASDGLKFVLGY